MQLMSYILLTAGSSRMVGPARFTRAFQIPLLVFSILTWAPLIEATMVAPRSLSELVRDADHVVIAKIERVEMVDEDGNEIKDEAARTGPGLQNELRFHITLQKDGLLKTNSKRVPQKLVIPLWQAWHYSLGQWKPVQGKTFIFLLKGEKYQSVYPAGFERPLSEQAEIEKLIREHKKK